MRFWLRLRIVIVLLILSSLTSITLRAGERTAEFNLQRSIDRLFTKKVTARASTSVKIISAETGDVLYERNARTLLTPASTMKLISSATALAKLGRGYSFRTVIATDDTTTELNAIRGNLYLQGFGDPYLTRADLKNLSGYLYRKGVREIHGDVIGDESFFNHASACNGINGKDLSSIRLPHLSSLTVDLNLMNVTLRPARKKGARVQVDLPVSGSFFKVLNQCVSVNERARYRPTVKATWNEGGCTIQVSGRMTIGSGPRTYALPVASPASYAAAVFFEELQREGISVSGGISVGTTPGTSRELVRNRDPIQSVLTAMNKESDNFAAEMVSRTLGAELIDPPGSIEKGVEAMKRFLDEAGVPQNARRIYDGSGISHENAVSANAFTALLRYMYTHKELFDTFHNTLPAAGVDGTLRGRMIGTDAAGNLYAKTGTLTGVTSLAGYVTDADNELLVFSITSADAYSGKKRYKSLQDKIGVILAGFSRNRYSNN